MIKALSLAAALALLPLSAAMAQQATNPSEAALETAATAFEARMETFGQHAAALSLNTDLPEAERERRMAALWAEYQPDVAGSTARLGHCRRCPGRYRPSESRRRGSRRC